MRDAVKKNNVEIDDDDAYEGKASEPVPVQSTPATTAPVPPKPAASNPNHNEDILGLDMIDLAPKRPLPAHANVGPDDFDLLGGHITSPGPSQPVQQPKASDSVDILDFDLYSSKPVNPSNPIKPEPKRPGIFDVPGLNLKKQVPPKPVLEFDSLDLEPSEFQESWEEFEHS